WLSSPPAALPATRENALSAGDRLASASRAGRRDPESAALRDTVRCQPEAVPECRPARAAARNSRRPLPFAGHLENPGQYAACRLPLPRRPVPALRGLPTPPFAGGRPLPTPQIIHLPRGQATRRRAPRCDAGRIAHTSPRRAV